MTWIILSLHTPGTLYYYIQYLFVIGMSSVEKLVFIYRFVSL